MEVNIWKRQQEGSGQINIYVIKQKFYEFDAQAYQPCLQIIQGYT